MAGWIACTDRLPELRLTDDRSMETSANVLVYAYLHGSPEEWKARGYTLIDSVPRHQVVVRLYRFLDEEQPGWSGEETEIWLSLPSVTHWMPLPAPPDD